MGVSFNINTDALIRHTNRLEKLKKSALPKVIRNTLNSAAFDVKQTTMPATAREFIQRKPSFFKRFSKVAPAPGSDIKSMVATVGFTGKDQAVEDLEQQENAGNIDGRSFIPMNTARVGNSQRKGVKVINRFKNIGHIINAAKGKGSDKQRFIKAAYMAVKLYGNRAYVLGNKRSDGKQTLSRIDEIWGSTRRQGGFGSRKLQIKRTPLYSFKKGRHVDVKGTRFMKRASMESGLKINDIFITNARKELARL